MSQSFDRIARAYRWMEYLSFGPLLHRCREHFLPQLLHSRRALILGDGDGRFCSRLLSSVPQLTAVAVDSSPAMLHLLRQRCRSNGSLSRLRTHCGDATLSLPGGPPFDLAVTHFFLDCFSEPQIARLAENIRSRLLPGALWVVSEFRVPEGVLRRPAALLITAMYGIFGLLTGLRARRLPRYTPVLAASGFVLRSRRTSLAGILVADLWQLPSDALPHSPL